MGWHPSSRQAFVIVLVVGVVGTGLVDLLLFQAGLRNVGRFVWILGYGTTIAVLWFGWLRPLDISGP